jgi:imidazolonepropionase-like amidohydrolase
LREIDSVPATVDSNEIGDFNPQLAAAAAVHPSSEHIPVGRAAGVTHVLSVPGLGSRIGGQASLINLSGWVTEEMLVRRSAAMEISWPSLSPPRGFGGFGGGGGRTRPFSEIKQEYDRRVNELEEWLERARHYQQAIEKGSKENFERDLKLEALVPVVKGELPVLVMANDSRDIKNAAEFCEKQKLKMILAGGREAWKVKDLLKQKNIPVVLSPVQVLPQSDDEPYDKPYSAPGELAAAGVKLAFGSFTGNNSAVEAHTIMYEAGQAVAFGLPHETALAALTRNPAEIYGVAAQLGTIEAGKVANLTVTSGDALELTSEVRYVFIKGQLQSLDNRHKQLYEKYRARP